MRHIFFFVLFVIGIIFLLKLVSTSIFLSAMKPEIQILEICNVKNLGGTIYVRRIPSHSTSQKYVQLARGKGFKDEVIWQKSNYDTLIQIQENEKDSVSVILGFYLNNEVHLDTFQIPSQ